MKRFLLLATLLLVGCPQDPNNPPTPPTLAHMLLSWNTNGNPAAVVCKDVFVNCVVSIEIHDTTTNAYYSVPPDSTSYTASGATDTFEARVTGYDGAGHLLTSTFAAIPIQAVP